jgi:predicted NACHT family NTPase
VAELSPAGEADQRLLDAEKGLSLLRGSFTMGELLELAPEVHPWVTRRWVVRGDPGSGKTTLLRHLAARLAEESPPRWVPVFQSLPVLLRKREFLLDRIERQMGRADHRGMAAVLEREGQEGRLLLLLDGLDEVEDREDAETLLRSCVSWHGT